MTIRVKLRTLALILSLGYTIVRVMLVQATLAGYGINPWAFAIIDAISGVLYVLGIEQLIVAMDKRRTFVWRKVILWGVIAIVSFAAPYIYLFLASREMPVAFGVGLGVIVVLLFANAIVSFRRRVYQGRG